MEAPKPTQSYYSSHGKLLLTGEYLVLKGARALALPVKYKQWMTVEIAGTGKTFLEWEAKNNGNSWFKASFNKNFEINYSTDIDKAQTLKKILVTTKELNSNFMLIKNSVTTDTDFPVNWGLGSSSTLLVNIAKWADIDAYELFFKTSNGSGFDIACSLSDSPIIYKLENKTPVVEKINFLPSFHNQLYFVYQGKKQNSSISVETFLKRSEIIKCDIEYMNKLTEHFISAGEINKFKIIMNEHETLLSYILNVPPLKHYFPDFEGEMKSLGAWGGDFMLVTWERSFNELQNYFSKKGIDTIIPFKDMLL